MDVNKIGREGGSVGGGAVSLTQKMKFQMKEDIDIGYRKFRCIIYF